MKPSRTETSISSADFFRIFLALFDSDNKFKMKLSFAPLDWNLLPLYHHSLDLVSTFFRGDDSPNLLRSSIFTAEQSVDALAIFLRRTVLDRILMLPSHIIATKSRFKNE